MSASPSGRTGGHWRGRLSFDLIGLRRRLSRCRDSSADESPDAYAQFVEDLLAIAALRRADGDRLAGRRPLRDTIGYHSDTPRNVFPYRDYVIRAFNDNIAVRPVHDRATGGRPPRREHAGSAGGVVLQPAPADTEEGGAQAKDYEARMLTDRERAVAPSGWARHSAAASATITS